MRTLFKSFVLLWCIFFGTLCSATADDSWSPPDIGPHDFHLAKHMYEERLGLAAQADKSDLLENLRTSHPRLMVTDKDLNVIRQYIDNDPVAKEMLAKIQRRADKIVTEPLSQPKANASDQLELSRLVLKRVETLAGTYRLTHNKILLERARAEMLQAAKLATWNPNHFLDVAEMTNALAIGYDWLYSDLSSEDRHTIKDAIVQLGLKEGIKAYENPDWWVGNKNNWNIVCNAGMVAGALAVADEEPQLANRVLRFARVSVPRALSSFAPDGGWSEGPMYWAYCTRYLAFLCADLQSALGTDFGFTKAPGVSRTGYFRIYFCGPLDKNFNFADSVDEVYSTWQMLWLSRIFNNPIFAGHDVPFAKDYPELFDLLLYVPKRTTPAQENLPLNALFQGVNVAFFRSSWTDPNALFIGFKGGDNKAGHSHLDLGTFVLDWGGARWAMDLGPDNYELPGYFEKERFTYYRLRTEGQNCVTVADDNQHQDAKAAITKFSSSGKVFAAADLSDAYRGSLTKANRGIAVVNDRQVVIADEFVAPHTVPVTWHWHTQARVTLSRDARSATLEQDGPPASIVAKQASSPKTAEYLPMKKMHLRILSPSGAKFSFRSCTVPQPQMVLDNVTDLTIKLELPAGQSRLAVLVSPDDESYLKSDPFSWWSE